jgi:hypothetical protein
MKIFGSKFMMSAVLILGLALAFNACKDDGDEDDYGSLLIGTWEGTWESRITGTVNGEPYSSVKVLTVVFTFQEGGRGIWEEQGGSSPFSWTLKGDTLIIVYDSGDEDGYKIEKLTSTEAVLDDGSYKITCKKIG